MRGIMPCQPGALQPLAMRQWLGCLVPAQHAPCSSVRCYGDGAGGAAMLPHALSFAPALGSAALPAPGGSSNDSTAS